VDELGDITSFEGVTVLLCNKCIYRAVVWLKLDRSCHEIADIHDEFLTNNCLQTRRGMALQRKV